MKYDLKKNKKKQMSSPYMMQSTAGIPTYVDGRETAEDFIFFSYQLTEIDPRNYEVVVQYGTDKTVRLGSLFNPTAPYNISHSEIKLPSVRFGNEDFVLVIPRHKEDVCLPKFIGVVRRGYTYELSVFNTRKDVSGVAYYIMT
jgi:hypothetical protein